MLCEFYFLEFKKKCFFAWKSCWSVLLIKLTFFLYANSDLGIMYLKKNVLRHKYLLFKISKRIGNTESVLCDVKKIRFCRSLFKGFPLPLLILSSLFRSIFMTSHMTHKVFQYLNVISIQHINMFKVIYSLKTNYNYNAME